jgi:hypothetical protein
MAKKKYAPISDDMLDAIRHGFKEIDFKWYKDPYNELIIAVEHDEKNRMGQVIVNSAELRAWKKEGQLKAMLSGLADKLAGQISF